MLQVMMLDVVAMLLLVSLSAATVVWAAMKLIQKV